MLNLSYFTSSEIKGEIKVDKPIRRLGPVTDIDGQRWDIRAIINNYVLAIPETDLHPFYKSTNTQS